jgi:hypothetical protein
MSDVTETSDGFEIYGGSVSGLRVDGGHADFYGGTLSGLVLDGGTLDLFATLDGLALKCRHGRDVRWRSARRCRIRRRPGRDHPDRSGQRRQCDADRFRVGDGITLPLAERAAAVQRGNNTLTVSRSILTRRRTRRPRRGSTCSWPEFASAWSLQTPIARISAARMGSTSPADAVGRACPSSHSGAARMVSRFRALPSRCRCSRDLSRSSQRHDVPARCGRAPAQSRRTPRRLPCCYGFATASSLGGGGVHCRRAGE